jgi:hypothetical protein
VHRRRRCTSRTTEQRFRTLLHRLSSAPPSPPRAYHGEPPSISVEIS